jgi:hypothetical protein
MTKVEILKKIIEISKLQLWDETVISRLSAKEKIVKPIFIIGSCRSGTSIFHRYLCRTFQVAYFTKFSSLYPEAPIAVNQLGVGLSKRLGLSWHEPNEAASIWDIYCPQDNHYMVRRATTKEKCFYRKVVRNHLWYFNRLRFLNKCVRHTVRLNWLISIFPDLQIIHLIRDGRAVASSILERIKNTDREFWGPKPRNWKQLVKKERIVRVGLQWMSLVEEGRKMRCKLKDKQYKEIKYEDFVSSPRETIVEIGKFCGLEANFNNVNFSSLRNFNFKWRENLEKKEKEKLLNTIGSFLNILNMSCLKFNGMKCIQKESSENINYL